jgi:tetratricopeptide (TPR) repeat protein
LERRKGRAAAEDEQSTLLIASSQPNLGAEGRFRTVGETGWEEFRVQPAAVALGYIPRDVQRDLHDRLVEGRAVLIVGHSMAGKTRMASEVVRKLYRDWPVWIPERPDGLAQVMTSGVPQQTVVWLDDLEAFLTSEQQLRLSWLAQLENAGCRVVATIRSAEYEKFQPVGEVKPPQWEVLQRFRRIQLLDNEDEQERIAAKVDDKPTAAGIRRYGIAEYVGGGYLALDRFQNGQAAHPLAVAMLRAAADWRRLGFESIPAATMSALARAYLPDKLRTSPGEDDTNALEWASTEFGGRIRLLEPAGDGTWRVFDYLLDYLTNQGVPVPDHTWVIAAEAAQENPGQASLLGYRAYLDGRIELATNLWQSVAPTAPAAAFNLGVLQEERGNPEAAATAYQQAIDTGHPEYAPKAAFYLGLLHHDQGDPAAAATVWKLAIETGHPDHAPRAAFNLGLLHQKQGDPAAAAVTYQLVIDTDHPDHAPAAAVNLGLLHHEQGDLVAAAAAWTLALDTDHPEHAPAAAVNLGLLHQEQGDPAAAATAYELAIDTGHPDISPKAAVNLGTLRRDQGHLVAAANAFQLAIDTGHPEAASAAALGFGLLQLQQGDFENAATALQQAIDVGHPDVVANAAYNLGVLHQQQGDLVAATTAYQQAIDTGRPDHAPRAAVNLGVLHQQQGDLVAAATAWKQAIDTGHPDVAPAARVNLALLYREQGNLDDAATACQQAIETGHPDQAPKAALVLGEIRNEQGDLEGAAVAYQLAIDTNHPEVAPASRAALDRLHSA